MQKIGDRVGAILAQKENVIELFGYGVYKGEAVPLEAVGDVAEMLKADKITSPKILLDSGKVLYGCETWWGPEELVKKGVATVTEVIDVDIDQHRRDFEKREKKK